MSDQTPRKSARQMLALIALATDLPVPETITFHSGILGLSFPNARDGQTWVRHFNAELRNHVSDGIRYVGQLGAIDWHGWDVSCSGSEPVTPDTDLDTDQDAALTELAEGGERS